MKILKNVLTFLLVASSACFFVISSFSFGSNVPQKLESSEGPTIQASRVKVADNKDGTTYIDKEYINKDKTISLDREEAGNIEFGLLASAFVLGDNSGTLDFDNFILSGTRLSFAPKYPTVYSLYDPFVLYTIESSHQDFVINQVTNGSFYVGPEKDGTISIYSIDAVVRLDFLSDNKIMSDMVLFPGMYIRFDPKMNSSLEGANLFRILQSLEPDGTQDLTKATTGIEFVNPRMDSTDDRDSFFMYKLPVSTNILFQMLHVMFYDQVSQIDVYARYGSSVFDYVGYSTADDWLINPGKKSHFLLLKLDSILASALQSNRALSLERFRTQIAEINTEAHTLAVGNAIQVRLEKFLTDGRFALFGGLKINPQFSDVYQIISDEVGKTPVTPHAKLLQRLSDIYSKNLVAQKKDLTYSRIDTYSPTALELEQTLQSQDIEQRDYFDIALYAFNVLKKSEDRGFLIDTAVYERATYSLIQTILISTEKYVASIPEPERKSITFQGIALHFYEHMLSMLARSMYNTFMEEDSGYLYLKPAFRPTITEPKIHISTDLIRDFQSINGRLTLTSDSLDKQYGKDSRNSVFISIKQSIAIFNSFASILDYESYNEYVRLPYVANTLSDTVLPIYESGAIVTGNPIANLPQQQGTVVVDPSVVKIKALLGDIPDSTIIRESGYYQIEGAVFQFPDPKTGKTSEIAMNVILDKNIEKFSNLSIDYTGKNIQIATDKTTATELILILQKLPEYISRLNFIYSGNPSLKGDIRFLENTDKIIIGIYPFTLRQ